MRNWVENIQMRVLMRVLTRYLHRFLKLWLFWFWAPALDVLAFFADPYIPDFSFPREVYWVIPLLGFVWANVKLFAELESEKQLLQSHIDELEDARANIRFKELEIFSFIASDQRSSPFPDLKVKLGSSFLDKTGLPGWVVIGAYLKGEKKSHERGELVWKIAETSLPPLFIFDGSNKGEFQWPSGCPFTRIDGWKDDFEARYELPLRIAQRDDARLFAHSLSSLDSYRVVIRYWTSRGIDSESKPHCLLLEGDFQELREELCEKWKSWGFSELAQIAKCQ
jgi:hypothetical protein